MTRTRTLSVLILTTAVALSVAGCSGDGDKPAASAPTTAPAPTSNVETPKPSATPQHTADVSGLTCETLISDTVASSLLDQGWKPNQAPLYIAETQIPSGLLCTWGPPDVVVGTDGQMYGFGVADEKLSAQAQQQLTAQGWTSEQTEDGVYVTAPAAPPAPAPAPEPSATDGAEPQTETPGAEAPPADSPDAEGAPPASTAMDGFTYLFGPGWVKFADTRDGLILIQAP